MLNLQIEFELPAERTESLHKTMPFEIYERAVRRVVRHRLIPFRKVLSSVRLLLPYSAIDEAKQKLIEMSWQAAHGRWHNEGIREEMFRCCNAINHSLKYK